MWGFASKRSNEEKKRLCSYSVLVFTFAFCFAYVHTIYRPSPPSSSLNHPFHLRNSKETFTPPKPKELLKASSIPGSGLEGP